MSRWPTPPASMGLPVGHTRGLQLTWASASTVQVSAGSGRADGDGADIVLGAPITLDMAIVGIGGRVVAEAADTMYHAFIGSGSSGTGGFLDTDPAGANAPAGYDQNLKYVGSVANDGSSDFIDWDAWGAGSLRRVKYRAERSVLNVVNGASSAAWVDADYSALVPFSAREVQVGILTRTSLNAADRILFRHNGTAVGTPPYQYNGPAAGLILARQDGTLPLDDLGLHEWSGSSAGIELFADVQAYWYEV